MTEKEREERKRQQWKTRRFRQSLMTPEDLEKYLAERWITRRKNLAKKAGEAAA